MAPVTTLIDTAEQAVVVVIRPDGDPGVLINPRYGWLKQDVVTILRAIADRLAGEVAGEYSHPDPL
jgi:hypothetical protein